MPGARSTGVAGLAGALGVAEPFGGVVAGQAGDAVPGGFLAQHVAGVAGGGQRDHRPDPGLLPGAGHLDRGAGLAGPGRADHHLGPPRRGQHVPGGGGLIHPQPAPGRSRPAPRCPAPGWSCAWSRSASAPSSRAATAGSRCGAPGSCACARSRSSRVSCAWLAYRSAPCGRNTDSPSARRSPSGTRGHSGADSSSTRSPAAPLMRAGGEGLQGGAVGHRPGRERLAQVADQVGLGPRRYARLADRDRLGHHLPRLILAQPARRHRVRHRPRPLLRRAGRRAGAGLRPGDLAPDLILRLHVGALLRLPPAQEQRRLHRPGVGAVAG